MQRTDDSQKLEGQGTTPHQSDMLQHATDAAGAARETDPRSAERLVTVATGGLLALYGLTRRSWTGAALTAAGAALAYAGSKGRVSWSSLYKQTKARVSRGAVAVEQTITIRREPHEVYAFWRKLENLPHFMRHLKSVTETSDIRSHWVVQAPVAGKTLEWDAEITTDLSDELIRWRSLPNETIEHSGEVRFAPVAGGRSTEVRVKMEYRIPAGTAATAASYPVTKQMLKEEIRRLKKVLEAGIPGGPTHAEPQHVM